MEKVSGPEGIECYRVNHSSGAEATFALQGGHLISWKTADGIERLFLSEKAAFGPASAIRGGVPVIFPQFSDHGPFGRHGFARKSEWSLAEDGKSLHLKTSHETLKEWPHSFELDISAELTEAGITISFSVFNPGDTPFEFYAALHTYLKANLRGKASVSGLGSHSFLNEVTKETETENHDQILFGSEIDRAYYGTSDKTIHLEQGGDRIEIGSENFPDTVIWNPGPDNGIGDLTAEGWKDFVCIEAAHISDSIRLNPNNAWTANQQIKILP